MPGQKAVLKRLAGMAGELIKKRILGPNVDSRGRRLPKLAGGSFWAQPDDVRWSGSREPKPYQDAASGDVVRLKLGRGKNAWAAVRLFRGGYAEAKRRAGAKPRRDGMLTGSMWKSLAATVGSKGVNSKFVRIFFAGTDAAQRRYTGKRLKSGKWQLRAFKQGDKAWHMQREGGSGRGRALFALMGLTPGELGTLRDFYVPRLRLFRSRG